MATTKTKKLYRIPFDGKKMMDYSAVEDPEVKPDPKAWGYYVPTEWRENVPFFAELVLDGYARGRSAVRFYVLNVATGDRYSFGQASFYEAVLKCGVRNKTLCGKWKFKKQGANYMLVMCDDE